MTDPVVPTPPPAAPVVGVKQTLSIVGFVAGLVAFVLGWIPFFGLLVAIAAIVISIIAHRREPAAPAWMWIVGLIGGILGGITGLIVTIITIFGFIAAATVATTCGVYCN
jgi:hypothetical protein